jgi:hypothetical protein
VRRREFSTVLGGAATAWPLAASAQQPAVPVIGFLHPGSRDANAGRLRGFDHGLKEAGYVEGESVAVVYRFAENQVNRLPELAADLVHRRVAVIVATTGRAPLVAQAATTTIPIVSRSCGCTWGSTADEVRPWESMLNYGSCLTMASGIGKSQRWPRSGRAWGCRHRASGVPGGKRSGQKGKVSRLGPAGAAERMPRPAQGDHPCPTGAATGLSLCSQPTQTAADRP